MSGFEILIIIIWSVSCLILLFPCGLLKDVKATKNPFLYILLVFTLLLAPLVLFSFLIDDKPSISGRERKKIKKYVVKQMNKAVESYDNTEKRTVEQCQRDRDIREVCLMRAGYQCEIDSEHTSFTTVNGRQYVESHHIIPLKYQDQFNFNLDTVDNLIALCPNCHKAIHYGSRRTKEMLLKQIHNIRPITEYEKLLSFYK